MNAQTANDQYGKFFFCELCLLDHESLGEANQCCSKLVLPDLDMTIGRQPKTPLTANQIEHLTRPRLMVYRRPGKEVFK